jgi:hypothetical protein
MTQSQMFQTLAGACQITIKSARATMDSLAHTTANEVKKVGYTMLNLVFRCSHRSITAPFTPVSKSDKRRGDTYVTCLDCGTHFYYDWAKMRIGGPIPKSPYRSSRATTNS